MNLFSIVNLSTYRKFLKPLISIFIIYNLPNYDKSILPLILVIKISIIQILRYP